MERELVLGSLTASDEEQTTETKTCTLRRAVRRGPRTATVEVT